MTRQKALAALCAILAAALAFGWEGKHQPPPRAENSPLLYPVKGGDKGWGAPPPRSSTKAIEPISTSMQGGYTTGSLTIPSGCREGISPDRRCSPGATDRRVTQGTIGRTICVPGWSASVRPPESATEPLKRQLMDAYGLAGVSMRGYELDHVISLELGGAPLDTRNLFPEREASAFGASAKDRYENAYHRAVCDESMTLARARYLMTHWPAQGS